MFPSLRLPCSNTVDNFAAGLKRRDISHWIVHSEEKGFGCSQIYVEYYNLWHSSYSRSSSWLWKSRQRFFLFAYERMLQESVSKAAISQLWWMGPGSTIETALPALMAYSERKGKLCSKKKVNTAVHDRRKYCDDSTYPRVFHDEYDQRIDAGMQSLEDHNPCRRRHKRISNRPVVDLFGELLIPNP